MLSILRIKNLALVDDLSLEFRPGFNAITGETGAGKSIIIGALSLILGERADRTFIRSGAESCTVEAVFALPIEPEFNQFLVDNGAEPSDDGELLLKRTFTLAGGNRQFINGSPVTLQCLSHLGERLVDMHGPHEHQSLFSAPRQLNLLDSFAGNTNDLDQFRNILALLRRTEEEKTALGRDLSGGTDRDLLEFQLGEIRQARVKIDEEATLEEEYGRLSNAARLLEASGEAMQLLADGEVCISNQAGQMGRLLQEMQRLDASAGCLLSLHDPLMSSIRDLQSDLRHYVDRVEINPERLTQVEERLALLRTLRKKYGPQLADVLEFADRTEATLQRLSGGAEALARLDGRLADLRKQLQTCGGELSKRRRQSAPELQRCVMIELRELGFKHAAFEVAVQTENREPSSTGFESVEFMFSPNRGEPLRPLRAIASSGEMARVMLGLKTVLAEQDRVPVLVFDEIDANVGGEAATVVGKKMRALGKKRQVLCITHLAPVAAMAPHHFRVAKFERAGRTLTSIALLDSEERLDELGRMLGGQPGPAREHAAALLIN